MSWSSDEGNGDFTLKVEDDDIVEEDSDYEGISDDTDDDPEIGSDFESAEEPENGFTKPEQPPPSEWIEFNKKVISMRPLFKSAKVQFANKLTRQIKMLRNRKGEEGQVDKSRRKAERLVEEITYVNRLKRDIIAKFALLHSKEEITKIVNDPGSSMEYRVKAKVAAMPKISKAADDYHQTHPDWRETLIKLMQLAGGKMKKKRRKMRGKGKKPRKKRDGEEGANKKKPALPKILADDDGTGRFDESNFPQPPPEVEDLVVNTDSSDQENSGDENEWNPPAVRFGSSSEEPSSEEESLNLRATDNRAKNSVISETVPNRSKGPPQRKGKNIEQPPQNAEKPVVETNSRKPMKRKGEELGKSQEKMPKTVTKNAKPRETKNVSENSKTKEIEKNHDSYAEHSESDEEELEEFVHRRDNVDPFFMTSDNKEYKTLWKVEPADSFKNKDKEKEPSFVFKNARTYQEVISGKPDKRTNKTVNRKDKKQLGKTGQNALGPIKLHPSWQAKKKQNLTAVPFQGKKIVFDDD